MNKYIDWYLKCPVCGLEFSVIFNADETEENKKIIKTCPCGSKAVVLKEKKYGREKETPKGKVCNGCDFLNINEEEQDRIKAQGGIYPHICKKYRKRLSHHPYREPYIHPCEECMKGGER